MPLSRPPDKWWNPPPEWFKTAFKDDYLLLYASRTAEQAVFETERITRELGISKRDRVLDLCCGHGRHLEAFEKLAIPVVGVDLSMQLLRRFALVSAAHGAAIARQTHLVRADMRALPFLECFDVVVNFFTSFGYFEAERDHLVAAEELAGALKRGGRFSMDLINPETTIRTLKPYTMSQAESFDVVERRRYHAEGKRIEKHIELHHRPTGKKHSYQESVRIFSKSEITKLLARAGLRVERVLGDFSGVPYARESPRMIVLGRKAK